MLRRWHLMAALVAILASNSGCMTCCHEAMDRSLAPTLLADLPCGTQRHRVHVVIINGFDPLHIAHIENLRDKLNQCGFAKVSVGEWYHSTTFEKELARLRCEDPDLRVVVVGYSIGAGVARGMCSRIVSNGGTVDSLIELAPVYLPIVHSGQSDHFVGRRVVVSPSSQVERYRSENATHVAIPSINHYAVPSNEASISTIVDEVRQAAERVTPMETITYPTLPLVDNPAPMPGRVIIEAPPAPPPSAPQNLASQPTPSVIPPNTTRTPTGTLTGSPSLR